MKIEITAIRLKIFWLGVCLLSFLIVIYGIINNLDIYIVIGLIISITSSILPFLTSPILKFEGRVANFCALPFSNIADLGIDRWNWDNIVLSEVSSLEIIKLKNKIKRKKVTKSRFLFKKYLKIGLVTGKEKYIYISLFSKKQVNKIIEMFKNNTKYI